MTIGQIVRSQVLLHGAGVKDTRGNMVYARVADLVFSLALALALALGAAAPALAMDAPQTRWSRLWGQGALDTMQRVVGCGDASEYGNAFADGRGGTVVVATMGGYWDALTASGLAGIEDAPLLMTDASSLSSQTASELERLSPEKVVICGGDMAVSEGVEGEISDLTGAEVVRLAGTDAQDTARRVHGASDKWSKTAFVATVASFQDALSVAPYAYAEHCPIFLTGWDGRLSGDTLSDIEAGGFDSVYVVGGSMVVSPDVEGQLGGLFAGRLWGADAADTSRSIAEWELGHGMSADGVGVATVSSYYDALCGAALCGRNGSVLVLVSGSNLTCVDGVVAANSDDIGSGYIFGGEMAVPASVADALARATADPFPDVDAGYQGSITYKDGVVVVPDAGWTASADGSSVTLKAGAVPDGVAAGTTVALTGAGSAGEAGRLLRVTSVSSDGGSVTLTGTTPDVSDAVESIDAEGVTSDVSSFVPADGVTVEGASSAGDALSPQDEWSAGKITAKAKWGHFSISFSVEPTVEYSVRGMGKDMTLYLGISSVTTSNLTFSSDGGKDDVAATEEKLSKRIGVIKMPTKVPGMYVALSLWAVFDVRGSVSVQLSSTLAAGVRYQDGRWSTPHRSSSSFDGIEAKGEFRKGEDIDVSLDILDEPVVDAAFGAGLKVEPDYHLRPTGLQCFDFEAEPYLEISAGTHSKMGDLGLTYSKDFVADLLTAAGGGGMRFALHYEDDLANGGGLHYVEKCTWDRLSIAGAQVTGLQQSYPYSDGPVVPAGIGVTLGGTRLTEGVDYELSCKDNTEPGVATLTVKGVGSYKGTSRLPYTITRADISDADVGGISSEYRYTGSAVEPEGLTVTVGGRKLTEGKDYSLSYSGNVEPGTATVTISGVGGYEGTLTRAFTIASKGDSPSDKVWGTRYSTTDPGVTDSSPSTAEYLAITKDGRTLQTATIDGRELALTKVGDSVDMSDTSGWDTDACSALGRGDVTRAAIVDWVRPASCRLFFGGMNSLVGIDCMWDLDTSVVTDMGYMFYGCSGLASLDLSPLDTSNVTDMGYMFYGCSGLASLDLSPLDTSNVTDMGWMFYDCSGLASLDLSPLDTSSVLDMSSMFEACSRLTSLDLSPLKTSNVTNMFGMFSICSGLKSLDLTPLDTSCVTNMGGMFSDCSGLTSLDLTPLDTSKVTSLWCMFFYCSNLTSLDLTPLDTSGVTDMTGVFWGCSGLTSLDLTPLDTSNVTDMRYMFEGCAALSFITYGPKFVKADGLYTEDMFYNCPANKPSWWTES